MFANPGEGNTIQFPLNPLLGVLLKIALIVESLHAFDKSF